MDQEEPKAALPKQNKSGPFSTQVRDRWLWVVRIGTIPPVAFLLWMFLRSEENNIQSGFFVALFLLILAPYLRVFWCLMQPNEVDRVNTGLWLALVWGGVAGLMSIVTVLEELDRMLRGSSGISFLGGALMLFLVLSHGALLLGAIKVLEASMWRRSGLPRVVVEAVAILGGFVVLAMIIPNVLESCCASGEATAISSLRNLVTSQITYHATTGQGRYAPDLATLSSQKLIDGMLGAGTKSGYVFTVSGEDAAFTVTAAPQVPGETGNRYFFADESGVIRYSTTGLATASSSPL